jgi:hypothetical protein
VTTLDERSRRSIVAVAVSGQQHGSVFLDAGGRVLRPAKLWCDTETAREAEELSKKMGETVVPAFTAPKVAWLAANEPGVAERVSCVCLPHDFVNMVLCGETRPVSEAGDASGTGYWNVEKREFDLGKAALVDVRLPSWLPALAPSPDAAVGAVCAAAAELTGLPAGIPVAPGSGDNACAALGVGAVVPGEFESLKKIFSSRFAFKSFLFSLSLSLSLSLLSLSQTLPSLPPPPHTIKSNLFKATGSSPWAPPAPSSGPRAPRRPPRPRARSRASATRPASGCRCSARSTAPSLPSR